MLQYPGIGAGNFLETAAGVSEPSWGVLEAVAGHPTEHRGTIQGRAHAKGGASHRRDTGLGQFRLQIVTTKRSVVDFVWFGVCF